MRFHGNSLTSRETVEAYLLYRAAELTIERGGDWFTILDREDAREVFQETRAHSQLAADIYDSFLKALTEVASWQKIGEVAFTQQRNRVLGL